MMIAGIDEVGRGCWFGPVVAAVVVIKQPGLLSTLAELGVKDSKKLSPKKRLKLAIEIQNLSEAFSIGYATVAEIDKLNILQASLLAMKRAVLKLPRQPELCLVDGMYPIPDLNIAQKNLIKGDETSLLIASASILAKVWRDELIIRWSSRYPEYDLANNKGYGTIKHRLALAKYGPSSQHRLSFRPCRDSQTS